jgi:hypothetical protein
MAMATSTSKISVTLPQPIYDRLLQFQSEQGLKSIGEALMSALETFFAASADNKVESLEAGVADLKAQMEAFAQAIAIIATRIDLMQDMPISLATPAVAEGTPIPPSPASSKAKSSAQAKAASAATTPKTTTSNKSKASQPSATDQSKPATASTSGSTAKAKTPTKSSSAATTRKKPKV